MRSGMRLLRRQFRSQQHWSQFLERIRLEKAPPRSVHQEFRLRFGTADESFPMLKSPLPGNQRFQVPLELFE